MRCTVWAIQVASDPGREHLQAAVQDDRRDPLVLRGVVQRHLERVEHLRVDGVDRSQVHGPPPDRTVIGGSQRRAVLLHPNPQSTDQEAGFTW
jgi:hypothetical protein